MEALGYVATLIMGFTIGLLGGGGSILTVPILVYLFSVRPLDATTSSLFIVGTTALVTSVQYRLRKEADLKIALFFALPSLIGIFLARSIVLPRIPLIISAPFGVLISKDAFVLTSFALLMIAASASMIRKRVDLPEIMKAHSPSLLGLQGVAVGFVTGFVGAGGGFIILPMLANVLKLPMRLAIGTSLFIIAINSLFGFAISAFRSSTFVDWTLQLTILTIALVGAFIGARVSGQVDEQKLKRGFGFFVLIVGLAIIAERLVRGA